MSIGVRENVTLLNISRNFSAGTLDPVLKGMRPKFALIADDILSFRRELPAFALPTQTRHRGVVLLTTLWQHFPDAT